MGNLHYTFMSIMSVFVLFGCSQKFDNMSVQVPFDHFSLSGTGYEWKEVTYPHDYEVAIINSLEELENYIICTEKRNIPIPIDFSQHTLLLARGVELYNNRATTTDLQQFPNRILVMKVDLISSLATVITNWQVAIIIEKLEAGDKVQLCIQNK